MERIKIKKGNKMKAKQIEKLLKGVMNNFLESINDSEIKTIIKENSYITGGCIPSMLMDEFVNDYDIYFYNKEDAEKVKVYFENNHTKNKDDKFHIKLITENSINLSDKIQLIIKFVGDPMFVIEKFDWQHIKSWYSCKAEKLHLTSNVYQLICEKELVYTGSDYPLSSLMRLKKYIKKGWSVSNTTILHIALDIVASFNKMEKKRQEEKQNSLEMLDLANKKLSEMSQEEFDSNSNIEETCQELEEEELDEEEFEGITNPVLLKSLKLAEKLEEQQFNIEDIIFHLNGVDPLIIQKKLLEQTDQYFTVREIIKIMNGE
jgi:hypothetical protein